VLSTSVAADSLPIGVESGNTGGSGTADSLPLGVESGGAGGGGGGTAGGRALCHDESVASELTDRLTSVGTAANGNSLAVTFTYSSRNRPSSSRGISLGMVPKW
jgi:hypothetical protein